MLRIGLIGCGGMGTTHAIAYTGLKDMVEVVAVADLDPKRAQEKAKLFDGARVYENGRALLEAEQLDAVDICLPTYMHTEYAVLAMEKDMHVFLEKPVCLKDEEAELLLATKKKTGKKVQIGQVIRFWDEYVWLKEAKDSGKFGKLKSGVFTRVSPFPGWGFENWYADPEKSGSCAYDLHIHDADFVRYLMDGDPDAVTSEAARCADGSIGQIFSTFRYGDVVISAEGAWDYPGSYPFSMKFRVNFEKGTALLDSEGLYFYPQGGDGYKVELKKAFDVSGDTGINLSDIGGYYNEIRSFVRCLAEDRPIERATLAEGLATRELIKKEIALCGGMVK